MAPSGWQGPSGLAGSFGIWNRDRTAAGAPYAAAPERSRACHAATRPWAARAGLDAPCFATRVVVVIPVAVVVDGAEVEVPLTVVVVAGWRVVVDPDAGGLDAGPGAEVVVPDAGCVLVTTADVVVVSGAAFFLSWLQADVPSSTTSTATANERRDPIPADRRQPPCPSGGCALDPIAVRS